VAALPKSFFYNSKKGTQQTDKKTVFSIYFLMNDPYLEELKG